MCRPTGVRRCDHFYSAPLTASIQCLSMCICDVDCLKLVLFIANCVLLDRIPEVFVSSVYNYIIYSNNSQFLKSFSIVHAVYFP